MAHFAELDENNIVQRVLVVNDDYILQNGIEVEQLGIDRLKLVYGQDTKWKQTSYNNNMSIRFGQVGFTYNQLLDAFVEPKPYDSWVLNKETASWEPPIPMPNKDDIPVNSYYNWNENLLNWEIISYNNPQ